MALEISTELIVCTRCGKRYGKRAGNFYTSYAASHKGIGTLPICKTCVCDMYLEYYDQCKSTKDAVRQMCRKLDIFWSERAYDNIINKSTQRTIMSLYMTKLNTVSAAGKSYDDSLIAEGTLWDFSSRDISSTSVGEEETKAEHVRKNDDVSEDELEIPANVIEFWGPGYTPSMYSQLEQRRIYWMSRIPDEIEIDFAAEATIRQICSLEIDINIARAAGKAVDKSVAALNSLLGNSTMKSILKRPENDDAQLEKTPLGVWLFRYENERPLPEIEDKYKDVRGILRYIFTWMGHLCKMLGKKNAYSDLYEREIEKYRVLKPEYDGDDDEAFMTAFMTEGTEDDQI